MQPDPKPDPRHDPPGDDLDTLRDLRELDEDEAEYADEVTGKAHERRPDASMTLITSMLQRPLDPGYEAAAEQRERAGLPRATTWRSPLLLVYLLIMGMLVGIAAASLRDREGARAGARAGLIEQIHERQAAAEEGTERARALQEQIDLAAGDVGSGGRSEIERLRVANGLVALTGPGLRVTLDDAPDSDTSADANPRSGASDEGRVLSRDLQLVTNGLWQSGAEAIAINGQRLTSRSAIRFAGEAILVNFRPLTRPYVIEAIGDPTGMQTAFAQSSAGTYLTGLSQNYGVQTSLTTQDALVLPGAVVPATEHATVPPSDRTGSPSPRPRQEDPS